MNVFSIKKYTYAQVFKNNRTFDRRSSIDLCSDQVVLFYIKLHFKLVLNHRALNAWNILYNNVIHSSRFCKNKR
jgi:hypothetical protein